MKSAILQASVCICTYNGAKRIPDVIEALAVQTLPKDLWEVLIIDNASTDSTRTVAEDLLRKMFPGRGRVVHEPKPGLSFARARAANAAQGEILCFLDDDNIPEAHFVENALTAFGRRPRAGVIGGKVLPSWEVAPTPLAEAAAPFALAICDLGEEAKLIDGAGGGVVGAGLCVRRGLLRSLLSPTHAGAVTDRTGRNLISGGDVAISVLARRAGFECWYDPRLVIGHVLPASRMEKKYLLRLYEGIGRGQAAVRKLYDWRARTPLAVLTAIKDLARWFGRSWGKPKPRDGIEYPELAKDLNDLERQLIWGRACQSLPFWR